ncbi:hypothetical protein C427_1373 [Paraglaciecola psychrophila 170]|uniref:Uncharacterized protein n=1 Tax=Paraglaciecola psychrophila 170 TaxID=1129794 RepID=K7ACN5_9ALTE|nr:hypothetical protein C427_1373 [Paraglaciecola psychrophila 170]GAC38423.1 hypothetical protein GPSY_2812 [Paraglaciecola psychrophila 170]
MHPALHNAESFSRGLPDRAVVHGEWQKIAALMLCCPMSPLGNGY